MLHWRHMRRRHSSGFSLIPSLPGLSPATRPLPFYLPFKTLIQQFDRRHNGDERLPNWLNPTMNDRHAFSDFLGQGVGLVSVA